MSKLSVKGNKFYINNEPVQIISGAMHYFRIVPEYWVDRLLKLKACGFNCVEIYIPWNLHEPVEGKFNFEGIANVEEFIRIADSLDLYVIARPSPYICAEWEFGGLPAWLLSDRNMRIRSYYKPFLKKVDHYYDELLPRLKPFLQTNGGPIIAMQIENEYGSYGNDKQYLNYIKDAMIQREMDVLLFTSDGPTDLMLQGGTIDNTLATVNFGSRPKESFDKLQEYFPNTPNFVMEFWNGWFDHWGEEHHVRDHEDVANTFEEMIKNGDSVNFYMFHGGTNFGFYNGANYDDKYAPTVTSYDYDCPISESGDLTPKFYAVRDIIKKYKKPEECHLPMPIEKKNYGKIELSQSIPLFQSLHQISTPVKTTHPLTMEELGQSYGFILYRTFINGPLEEMPLTIQDVRDRALVFLNDEYKGIIDRWDQQTVPIEIPKEGAFLTILVENMGRINYGPRMYDAKGITRGVRLERQFLFDWEIFNLPMDNLHQLQFQNLNKTANERTEPRFYRGEFHIDEIGDTFLELPGWTKGFVLINDFNLGRYWKIGPQKTLYVPGPILKEGKNEIIIFELHETNSYEILLLDEHKLG